MAEKKLKTQRGSLKSQLTLFEKYLKSVDVENIADVQTDNLKQRLEKIEPVFESFTQVQSEIDLISEDSEPDEKELEDFQNKYFDLVSKAKNILKSVKNEQNEMSANVSNISVSTETLASSVQKKPQIKLPVIPLPSFDGTFTLWREFFDAFSSLIHRNNELSDVQKLSYLRASLSGEPAGLLRPFETTDQNYQIAWSMLQKRYNNKRRIVNNHAEAILAIPSVSRDSYAALKQLINTLQNHIQCLKSLGQPVDSWDVLLVPIITSKLDFATMKEWENKLNQNENCNDKIPTLNEFICFLERKLNTLETLTNRKSTDYTHNKTTNCTPNRTTTKVFSTTNSHCVNCNGEHSLQYCESLLKLDAPSRHRKARELNVCINCLRKGHFIQNCESKSTCRKCNRKHHTILHMSNNAEKPNNTTQGDKTETTACVSNEQLTNPESNTINSNVAMHCSVATLQVLLSTARIHLQKSNDTFLEVRALLDSASQSNFITNATCELLKLKKKPINMNVTSINQETTKITHKVQVVIKSRINDFSATLTCLVVPNITSSLPTISFTPEIMKLPKNVTLADPTFYQSQKVDILIGASIFYNLLCVGQITNKSLPTLQKTKLGWVVSGPLGCANSCQQTSVSCMALTDLQKQVEKFWKMDEFISHTQTLTDEEQQCEDYFKRTTTRAADGKFIVNIPFKETLDDLGDSKQVAETRLFALEKRFDKDKRLKTMYTDFMQEYETLKHMTKTDIENIAFFLPHHPVIRESSETTKLRVVFDGSCKLTTGISVNETQCTGPTIQNDLFSIIARFRTHTYVLTGDIAKMYRCIWINPDHRKYQGILWRENASNEINCYQLNTVTYGTTAAPFLAIRCLFQLADECESKYPTESRVIKEDFYVDDLLTGASTVQELKSIKANIHHILESAGFNLRKYVSNDFDSDLTEEDVSSINEKIHRTLGIEWNPQTDTFSYSYPDVTQNRISKRTILAITAQLFDPLGLLGPVIITAKLIIQDLWQLSLNWDESVPIDIQTKWLNFKDKLKYIKNIKIPRHVLIVNPVYIESHSFADASEKGYGTCIYLRSINSEGKVTVQLLAAKSRVAPLKGISLPRLELCAAVIAAQLTSKFKNILTIKTDKQFFWTDSQIVICWIKSSPRKWKTYVANRISEIQGLSDPNDWYHVQSADNAADLISRGVAPNKLQNLSLWWNGPQWLSLPNKEWQFSSNSTVSNLPEARSQVQTFMTVDKTKAFEMHNYSSLTRLKRIVATCVRFKNNCVVSKNDRVYGPLSTNELNYATEILVKIVQKECFPKELNSLIQGKTLHPKSNLLCLTPFVDDRGIIRVGGRLQLSKFAYNKRHPMLLPKSHHLTNLVFLHEHNKLLHAGPKLLLSSVRESFWPICGKNTAKKTVRQCIKCTRYSAQSPNPIMGSLPAQRTDMTPPFHSTGVDYAGPFLLKDREGKGRKTITKGYICLFVCFSTKAIHLELVTSLTTNAFLAAFKRFIARRGKPLHVFSDNGSNFVGSSNELSKLGDFLKTCNHNVKQFSSNEGINWHFIPPNSPNFGGLWEAGVKSTKYHLKRVLNNVTLTYEEFSTIMIQIESILNSRPLTALTSDPNDVEVLTPAHFLIGRSFSTIPEPNLIDVPDNRLNKYQHLQKMIQHFWNKWAKEYIHELQQRNKWKKSSHNPLEVGAMVLLKDDNLPPSKWQLGRIIQLHPGHDGIIRVVTVKCVQGEFRRAVSKVCVLPVERT